MITAVGLAAGCGGNGVVVVVAPGDDGSADGPAGDGTTGDDGPTSDGTSSDDGPTGKDGATEAAADAAGDDGSGGDGGSTGDGGGGADASDAGTTNDAGSTSDAGSGSDAGSTSDAGSGSDSGTTVDAGSGAVCGNGVRETGEQCDDGNTTNLDGCSSTCRFEQDTRAIKLALQFGTDANCLKNAIGGAIGNFAQSTLQTNIDGAVAAGSINVLFTYLGITDLSGKSGTTNVGSVTGSPATAPAGTTYLGTNDRDWWYPVDSTSIDSSRNPVAMLLPGTFSNGVLTAGPGTIWIAFAAGQNLEMVSTHVSLPIEASNAPTMSTTGQTPGHLTAEHLDPTLTSFATGGGTTAAPTGWACGDVTAASLATTSVPAALQAGGADQCNQGYTASNSMLDVFVGGCTSGIFTIVKGGTQPDTTNPYVPPAGAGAPYTLSASTKTHVIDTCKDKSGMSVTLSQCLQAATYSMYTKMAVDRVILK